MEKQSGQRERQAATETGCVSNAAKQAASLRAQALDAVQSQQVADVPVVQRQESALQVSRSPSHAAIWLRSLSPPTTLRAGPPEGERAPSERPAGAHAGLPINPRGRNASTITRMTNVNTTL